RPTRASVRVAGSGTAGPNDAKAPVPPPSPENETKLDWKLGALVSMTSHCDDCPALTPPAEVAEMPSPPKWTAREAKLNGTMPTGVMVTLVVHPPKPPAVIAWTASVEVPAVTVSWYSKDNPLSGRGLSARIDTNSTYVPLTIPLVVENVKG